MAQNCLNMQLTALITMFVYKLKKLPSFQRTATYYHSPGLAETIAPLTNGQGTRSLLAATEKRLWQRETRDCRLNIVISILNITHCFITYILPVLSLVLTGAAMSEECWWRMVISTSGELQCQSYCCR